MTHHSRLTDGKVTHTTKLRWSVNLLELQLSPGHQYPGTSLVYFPGDWNGYELLVIRLFNPSSGALEINIKVHDRAHEKAYRYRDRFNLSTQVKPGWSDLEIRLNEIKNAPRERKMNMREISNLGIFTGNLKMPELLYVDKIHLSQWCRQLLRVNAFPLGFADELSSNLELN